jgi:hypothetical protein
VDELIKMAENDPDLSLALLKKIQGALENASGEDKSKLQDAAIEAAVNAAGFGQAVLAVLGELSSEKTVDADRLIQKALGEMKNLEAAGSVLFEILPKDTDPDFDAFIKSASADNLAMAAVLLLAGEAKKNDFQVGKQNDSNNEVIKLAEKLASSAVSQKDKLSGPLSDVLGALNL